MKSRVLISRIAALLAAAGVGLTAPGVAFSQSVVDPGPRGGAPGAGGAVSGLSSLQQAFFNSARQRFQEVDSVSGTIAGETGSGLGPLFNGNSCAMCHISPALGGSSPATNPQVALATLDGATNTVPSFITTNGPIREARFLKNPDGTPDGGVHDLFTITGRKDAVGCTVAQPDFATQIANSNVSFRIPTPLFGLGFIDNLTDDALQIQESNVASFQANQGISPGVFNRSPNDGTISKFGWKAQNKSLLLFAGEAYNVEQGVTNELMPNERDNTSGCVFNPTPEDSTNLAVTASSGSSGSDFSADIINFAAFIRLLDGPTPAAATSNTSNGAMQFSNIGCQSCHIAHQKDAPSIFGATAKTGLNQVEIDVFSDFALHTMGTGLADGISQGVANGQQFRTAPLWGLGQRLFFLHDGRTSDLLEAIAAHKSSGSEANTVVNNFNALSAANQQDIILFLRSL